MAACRRPTRRRAGSRTPATSLAKRKNPGVVSPGFFVSSNQGNVCWTGGLQQPPAGAMVPSASGPFLGLSRLMVLLVDLAAGLDPVLEAAEVVDLLVAHILEQLARQRRAAAGSAMQDHRLVERQALLGGGGREIGLELQRAARDVDRAGGLAGRRELGAVADVDQD